MLINNDSNLSLAGCCWQEKIFNQRLASAIKQKFDISDFLSRLLSTKVNGVDEVFDYLYPKIKLKLNKSKSAWNFEPQIAPNYYVARLNYSF